MWTLHEKKGGGGIWNKDHWNEDFFSDSITKNNSKNKWTDEYKRRIACSFWFTGNKPQR